MSLDDMRPPTNRSPMRWGRSRLDAKIDLLVQAARVHTRNPTKDALAELTAAAIEYAEVFKEASTKKERER